MPTTRRLNGVIALSIAALLAASASTAVGAVPAAASVRAVPASGAPPASASSAAPTPASGAASASAPSAPPASAAQAPLLTGIRKAQLTLFGAFDAGFARAFVNPANTQLPPGERRAFNRAARAFLQGEHGFLPAAQSAGADFLAAGSGATLARRIARAGGTWSKLSGTLSPWLPGSRRFVAETVTAEISFWRAVGRGVDAFAGASSDPSSLLAVIHSAAQTFPDALQHSARSLLERTNAGRARRATLRKLLGLGARGFTGAVDAGAQGFLRVASPPGAPPAPNPVPNPPPTPPPPPSPAHSEIQLHCPASAHESEVLSVSGTLSPADLTGATVKLLYYPPPSGSEIEPTAIGRQLTTTAGGAFEDRSVRPSAERVANRPPPLGTWRVLAEYAGDATHTSAIPAQCEILVEA
ncbi:MAG TPA: hypothetical protein VID29_05805 [Solirubrobacteraceae bacterium]